MRHYKGFTVSTSTFPTPTNCFDVQAQFLTRHTQLAQCTQLPTINREMHATYPQSTIDKGLPLLLKLHSSQGKELLKDRIYKGV